ncbi:MAG: hypothetical protein GDA37_02405 [Ekhidna sp.]|nr:hypothetical protein [Ekhidna sp.]
MKKITLLVHFISLPLLNQAQCAMCRTQVKNNVSHGETTLAEGLNNGIMFLFFTPYAVVFLMIFLWYRYSKVNNRKISLIERLKKGISK